MNSVDRRSIRALFMLCLVVGGVVFAAVQPIKATSQTFTVPDDYATIQEAVNHANTGDTVRVKSGSYSETVFLNKSLLLVGLNFPVIDAGGKGSPITINASNCVVDGFKVTGCMRSASEAGIKVQYYSGGNNTIRNNIAYGNSLNGISLEKTSYNSVINNTVFSNSRGIECWVESDDYLANNTVYSNGDMGILVGAATRMLVVGNIVYLNGEGGIVLDGCGSSYVGRNTVFSNQFGVYFPSGGSRNMIVGNNVSNNEWGFRWTSTVVNNFLFHNNVVNNTVQAHWYDNATFPAENFWNDTYPSGGNFWSNYTGTDANGDGIGDTPYIIGTNNIDKNPLIAPFHTADGTTQLVNFAGSFKDANGAPLYTAPSSFKLIFPNGTTSPPLAVGSYLIGAGIAVLRDVVWEGTDVTPDALVIFDTSFGAPTVRCDVYQLTVNPTFYIISINQTNNSNQTSNATSYTYLKPSSWSMSFPNGTTRTFNSNVTLPQTQTGDYILRSAVLQNVNVTFQAVLWLGSNTEWSHSIGLFEAAGNQTFGFDTNSTITQPDFNTTNRVLSFTVAGADGTSGYAKITFEKNLTGNPEDVIVRQDGNPIEYSMTAIGDSNLLAINYTHSTHNITVDFGASAVPEFPLFTPLLLLMLIAVLATVFLKHKRISKLTNSGALENSGV